MVNPREKNSRDNADAIPVEQVESEHPAHPLMRLIKPVTILPAGEGVIDTTTISPKFYNCFNYSLLSKGSAMVSLAVGITSANPREGKTLVAANLAVSLWQRRTSETR